MLALPITGHETSHGRAKISASSVGAAPEKMSEDAPIWSLVRDRARNLLPRRGLGARTAKSAHALTLAEMESCQTHEIHKEPQIT